MFRSSRPTVSAKAGSASGSDPEQLTRLAESCPQAVPTTVLGGDPCYDLLLEALSIVSTIAPASGSNPASG